MKNEYGIFTTCHDTAKYIIDTIGSSGVLVLPWTDGAGSQYDLLFALPVIERGVQAGLDDCDLLVGVVSIGLWGFDCNGDKYATYVAEKLRISPHSVTAVELSRLINYVLNEF